MALVAKKAHRVASPEDDVCTPFRVGGVGVFLYHLFVKHRLVYNWAWVYPACKHATRAGLHCSRSATVGKRQLVSKSVKGAAIVDCNCQSMQASVRVPPLAYMSITLSDFAYCAWHDKYWFYRSGCICRTNAGHSASKHVVVVGGGWAGFGAAYALLKAGLRVTILDASRSPGGLSSGWRTPAGRSVEAGIKG